MLAGGTFLGILINQGFLSRRRCSSLGDVGELRGIAVARRRAAARRDGHPPPRSSATSACASGWPVLARAFCARRQPARAQPGDGRRRAGRRRLRLRPAGRPAALGAQAVLRSPRGERACPSSELILGYYETCIAPDELLVEVRVPAAPERAVYRKFRSRSSEDRPCVAVAAARDGGRAARRGRRGRRDAPALPRRLRARARRAARRRAGDGDRPRRYAERIEPIDDARGSAALPAPRHRGRGAPRDRGARRVSAVGVDPRVTGAQRYSVDAERPGMLHAAFVRSPHPHARVSGVDALGAAGRTASRSRPEDVEDLGPYGCQVKDQRVLADVARHAGDVVAAVAAPDRAAARAAAARAIEVDYEELPAVFDAVAGGRARGAAAASRAPPTRRSEAVSIGVRPLPRHERLPPLPASATATSPRGSTRPTSSSRRSSARRARRTCRWSRTPRWPSGRTAG